MKKIFNIIFVISLFLFSFNVSASVVVDTRRVLEGVPLVGDIIRNAQREQTDTFHTHLSGVFYENVTADIFPKIQFIVNAGSLRANLERLAKKFGWVVRWELDTDYDVPLGFTIDDKKMPEIYAEALEHLPVRTSFYSKNKVIVVAPMYDKRETDVGRKYAINPR